MAAHTSPGRLTLPLRQRIRPLLALFCLAPWVGEYLLGNVPGPMLWALPFLAPLYGGGAILARETAVRFGLGWTGVLLLGGAYGVIEAGLVDQSLFNPGGFVAGSEQVTPVPMLGISAVNAVAFVLGHAVWSIALPIAFAGFLFPRAAAAPWLAPPGVVVVLAVYLLGCWIVFSDVRETSGFMATPMQRVGAAAVAAGLAALAFLLSAVRPRRAMSPPRPVLIGILGFGLSSAMVLTPESWAGLAMKLAVLVIWGDLGRRLGGSPEWTSRHSIAFAGGILMTHAWLGPVLTNLVHGGQPAFYLWNAGFAALAAALIALSLRRLQTG